MGLEPGQRAQYGAKSPPTFMHEIARSTTVTP
jgi:hypothetical protein